MKITEIIDNDNNVSRFSNVLGAGNIVPNIWYHKLLRPCGKSDCTAISILSELVFLHRNNGNTEFQLNFKYFKKKFNFGLSQVKDAVIRLEKLGLVTRSPRTVIILGRVFSNEMFLVLNIEQVLKLSEGTNKENDLKKFQQSIGNNDNPPTEISSTNDDKVEKLQSFTRNNHITYAEISLDSDDKTEKSQFAARNACEPSMEISAGSKDKIVKLPSFSGNQNIPSVEISSDYIYLDIDLYKNNNKKTSYNRSRSNESNFLKIFDEKNEETNISVANSLQIPEESSLDEETAEPIEQSNPETSLEKADDCCREGIIDSEVKVEVAAENLPHNQSTSCSTSDSLQNGVTKIWSKFNFFGKKLSEFYPLSKEDRDLLVVKSGRDFDLNFINQLLLKISDKYPDHKFYNKNSVLNYVAKLLTYELRDAVKVSNGCFRFKSNANDDNAKDTQIASIERYLQEIESSLDTSKAMQLKRKIAGIFESNIAYTLLLNVEFSLNGDEFIINANSKSLTSLSSSQQDILLEQIRSVYGNNILSLNIQAQEKTQEQAQTEPRSQLHHKLSNQFSSPSSANEHGTNSDNSSNCSNHANNNIPTPTGATTQETDSIWNRVRRSLIQHFRDGEWLDKAWFSKLEAIYDHDSQKLTLKAPTTFIRDRVWQQYGYLIERYCINENYQLVEVQS